ncbi:PilZ domain-containing protein [Rhodoferax sp.]|uniref:PilZ domain-containing protein n=1 Tax=Rhodoferax sp. TaxID=50421 RepID=UPI0025F61005|nr:PilZ domain-containing protein [Rhodoferax sp.]
MARSEQRVHTRATFFRIGSGSQAATYFAFRDANQPQALAALILDVSEGGVQILSQAGSQLTGKSFQLEMHFATDQGIETLDGGEIQWVWSEPDGIYTRSGFVARAEGHSLATFIQGLPAQKEHIIRCALYPVGHLAVA